MIFQHVIIGLIVTALGVVGLKYNYQVVGMTGHVGFIEDHLGYGSTYPFMKFLAVLLCLGGIMYTFGLLDPVLTWVLSPLAQFFPHGS